MASDKDQIDSISAQNFCDSLRQIRKELDKIHGLLNGANVDHDAVEDRTMAHYKNMLIGIDKSRFQLGYALGEGSNTESPYEEIDHQYTSFGKITAPVEEKDTADLKPLDLSPREHLMEIRHRAQKIYEKIKELHRRCRFPEDFMYVYLEQAIVHVREVRSSAGVVYTAVFDNNDTKQ